jgi:mRNA-degrading endonuclease toxin of MazEF toxin-antitoxin module
MYVKDFEGWSTKKQVLDAKTKIPFFNKWQIWWCSMGVNVGFEIFGKDKLYTRPVVILKKYSRSTFFGLPMTSKRKERDAFYAIDFRNKESSVILDQGRIMDARRLADKMGELPESSFQAVRKAFKDFH